jgi:hypothetical protein
MRHLTGRDPREPDLDLKDQGLARRGGAPVPLQDRILQELALACPVGIGDVQL